MVYVGDVCCPCILPSAGKPKTVSLGDHDTEEEAAHAFDRAAINKGGRAAKTNFPMSEYETEVTELTGDTRSQTTVPMTGVHCSQNM